MWAILHQFRQDGWNFRRQVQIGTYYADFACRRPAVVIEVDGHSHGSDLAQANDAVRDDYFRGRGYRVLRFWNTDVVSNPNGVFAELSGALAKVSEPASPPTPDPSPQGGGRHSASGPAR
jgi:very-short-patch-repair endonuclease